MLHAVFFFQAEDGIRDADVTGVQTCALPILTDADVLIPYYRDTATQLQRGVQMQDILLYWGGDERGSAWSAPAAVEDFPICVPIATQACHACGVAAAFRIRDRKSVV